VCRRPGELKPGASVVAWGERISPAAPTTIALPRADLRDFGVDEVYGSHELRAILDVWLDGTLTPLGGVTASGVNLAGNTWDVWEGTSGGTPIVSYASTTAADSVTFDLNVFTQDAVDRGIIQSSWYLTNVFVGFFIQSGGVGLATTDFYAIVN
jgi:hypothetical protein